MHVLCYIVQESGCSEELVSVVALLSVDSIFLSPPALRDKAAAVHRRFHSPHGDHCTLLAVHQAYHAALGKKVCFVCVCVCERDVIEVRLCSMVTAELVQRKLHSLPKP